MDACGNDLGLGGRCSDRRRMCESELCFVRWADRFLDEFRLRDASYRWIRRLDAGVLDNLGDQADDGSGTLLACTNVHRACIARRIEACAPSNKTVTGIS